jgi:hypothetical protein
MVETLALALVAAAAGASLTWCWRLSVQLDARERELERLRVAAARPPAAAPAPPPPAPAPAPPEPVDRLIDEIDRRRTAFATVIATRVVPARAHRGSEPFVLVVEVMLLNRGGRDVRLSLKTRENETPLVVRRYLGQPDKLYGAPMPAAPSAGMADAERGQRAQLVRADAVETLDFVVPLHDAGLYRLGFRVRGDEIAADDAKAGAPVIWARHTHVVVG